LFVALVMVISPRAKRNNFTITTMNYYNNYERQLQGKATVLYTYVPANGTPQLGRLVLAGGARAPAGGKNREFHFLT
jgi:hypothetical protein